jgi:hypothetical protein
MRSRWKIRFRAKLEGFYSQSSGGMALQKRIFAADERMKTADSGRIRFVIREKRELTGYWPKHDIIDFLKSQQIRKN